MPGYEVIGEEELNAVVDLFRSSGGVLFAHGFAERRNGVFRVRDLEQAVAGRLGIAHVQAVSSGSAALWCALGALGVGPGDEVVTQAFTFVATVEAILMHGATPVVVDVDESLTMDPDAFEAAITPRTKLVVPVHMAGVTARMDRIGEIAENRGIAVLEDAAQALGASFHGRPAGSLGEAAIVSLDFGKIVTCGEGGLVLTDREDLFTEIRCLHDHGHEYDASVPRGRDPRHTWGFNFRMSELQAAVALAQLDKLDRIVSAQLANKSALKTGVVDAHLPLTFRDLPDPDGDNGDTLFFFTEDASRAEAIAASLARSGVGTKNVPDAIDWHFAGTWTHMLQRFYDRPLDQVFRRTGELLSRCVAVPVPVLGGNEWAGRALDSIASCFARA